jgi:hypothetical protein
MDTLGSHGCHLVHQSVTEPPATIEEARAVVHLAVTIVRWERDGLIAKR